jgi:hypothetical protein
MLGYSCFLILCVSTSHAFLCSSLCQYLLPRFIYDPICRNTKDNLNTIAFTDKFPETSIVCPEPPTMYCPPIICPDPLPITCPEPSACPEPSGDGDTGFPDVPPCNCSNPEILHIDIPPQCQNRTVYITSPYQDRTYSYGIPIIVYWYMIALCV